jgi:predicted MPP superfamily phosphohydrolase
LTNLVVYEFLADVFVIINSSQLLALGIVLGIMTLSFIAANILGTFYYNKFTRVFNLLSAVWMGFFVYLFFASVIYALLALLPIAANSIVGIIFIMGAIVVSIYGVLHVKKISIVEIDVPLRNLSVNWKNKKAIWVSDLHLGQIYGASYARKIVEKIKTLPCDIIFIGGDLYDGTSAPNAGMLIEPLKELSAKDGIYYITGNHEEFGNDEKFISAVKSAGIVVLQDRLVEVDGMQLIGVDYHTTSDREHFKKILSGLSIDSKKTSILLKHEPSDLDIASEKGIYLQISGHTHRAQLWPLGYIANLVYKGYAYGLKTFGEMSVFTSSGVGTWGPPMRVGTNNEIVVFNFTAL